MSGPSAGPRGGRTRTSWTRRKRSAAVQMAEDEEVRLFFEDALTLRPALTTFDMDEPHARERLAESLWAVAGDILGVGS